LGGDRVVLQLKTLSQTQLAAWMQAAQARAAEGRVAHRIPRLAEAQSEWFAVQIYCDSEGRCTLGDAACEFPLMSVVKPFLLLYLLERCGAERVFEWVGVEPSDAPFNSLEQLKADRGRPRNPMINSGAIVLADKLPGRTAIDRCQQFGEWLNHRAGCELWLDAAMLASVRSTSSEPNRSIAQVLLQAGCVQDLDVALDAYEQSCCLSGRVADLARLGLLLAEDNLWVQPPHRCIVNALMLTCGLYEASGAVAVRVGLPMKSGVSGALLAIVPGQGVIACYSPALDRMGNSVVGLAFVEMLSQALQLSVFG
jgi:glutaminase